jgi:hypothetical protein
MERRSRLGAGHWAAALLCFALLASAGAWRLGDPSPASATTAPINITIWQVRLTDRGVTFRKPRQHPTIQQGMVILFKVVNKSRTPRRFIAAGQETPVLSRRAHDYFYVNFLQLGHFPWRSWPSGKHAGKVFKGHLVVSRCTDPSGTCNGDAPTSP